MSGPAPLSGRAEALLECLGARGAMFFDELAGAARLLRHELEEALGELVALGLASSDSFGGLRALLVPSGRRKPPAGAKRRGRVLAFDIESGGRWSMIGRARESGDAEARAAPIEHAARTLLKRYGVVFWRLLAQEPGWLPPWRDLLRIYRRLEARGEIRGGRFVAGFSGEQFALPDAVGLMREIRRRPASGEWVSLSGADPLNLIGILTPGQRLPALTANRVVYRDGLPVAALTGGKAQFLTDLEGADQWEAEKRLVRSAARGVLADLV
jgi:ATP-dependent helicase Lhr and Lhr-like helicase